jgi:hypothetical protein
MKTLLGDTEDTLLRQMRMEDQERVNQARLLDKQGGGNYYSGLIADAAQQQANVFSNLLPKGVRAVGGLLGQEDAAGKIAAGMEDPRLGKARQRKADLDMLSAKYKNLGSDKDGFTDKDAKVIVDDLMSLGYLEEAKKMAEIWQGRRKLDIDEIGNKARLQKARNAAKTGEDLKSSQVQDAFKDANGVRYRSVLYNFKDGSSRTFLLNDAGDIVPRSKVAGKETEWEEVDTSGMSSVGRIYEEGKKEGAKLGAKQADKWVDVRQSMINAGSAAKDQFKDLIRAYRLTSKIKTGGLQEIMLSVRQMLGVDSGDAGELASLFKTEVITRLKQMGAKPTDKDLEYLESSTNRLGSDRKTNQQILKRMVSRVDQIIARGEYLKKNPNMSREDFNNNDYKARTYDWRSEADPPVLTDKSQLPPAGQRTIGQIVRTNEGTFKWNGTKWDPIDVPPY